MGGLLTMTRLFLLAHFKDDSEEMVEAAFAKQKRDSK